MQPEVDPIVFRAAAVCALVLVAVAPTSFASHRASGEVTIVVTSSSDALNGDTSNSSALQASPGPDGISLREAIQATNNDPGSYAIRFTPDLAGHTIDVSTNNGGPLTLTGGNVSMDGDITGDGRPDITLRRAGGAGGPGLQISSGGNTLHAIALQRFFIGVLIQPVPADTARPSEKPYAGNTVSGLAISGGENGIGLSPNTGSRWLDTKILGNTMTVTEDFGISVQVMGAAGDRVEGVTIERNTVRVAAQPPAGECLAPGFAISVVSGGAEGDAHGRISDVLIDHNSVSGNPAVGIMVGPGGSGGFASTVERVRILDNRVDLKEERGPHCLAGGGVRQEIVLVAGDDNGTRTPEHDNVLQDVEVRGNWLTTGEGIRVFAGSGGARNAVRRMRIIGNTIHVSGPFAGVNVHGCEGGTFIRTTGSRISDLTIDANRITIVNDDPKHTPGMIENRRDGGIYVAAADFEAMGPVSNARVENVRITGNRIDTHMIGINLVGGNGDFDKPVRSATGNVLFNVLVARNIVSRSPLLVSRFTPQTRGISVVGGASRATGNRVVCVRITGNTVAGVRDAVSVLDNAPTASGNHVTLGDC